MKFDKDFLKLRKVKIGSNKYEYDLIYCGMNINGVDQYVRLKGIDKDGNIHISELTKLDFKDDIDNMMSSIKDAYEERKKYKK